MFNIFSNLRGKINKNQSEARTKEANLRNKAGLTPLTGQVSKVTGRDEVGLQSIQGCTLVHL